MHKVKKTLHEGTFFYNLYGCFVTKYLGVSKLGFSLLFFGSDDCSFDA